MLQGYTPPSGIRKKPRNLDDITKDIRARRDYISTTRVSNPMEIEQRAFKILQYWLTNNPRFLVHFSPKRPLFADCDASKARGVGAVIYHIKGDQILKDGEYSSMNFVELIVFLSRLLTEAEQRYWPIELELAGLIWLVQKIRHWIQISEQSTIIYTDHSITAIARSISLTREKLNL